MWQEAIVFIIVAAALLHASTKYLPLAGRRRLAALLAHGGISPARLAAWYKTEPACGDGCSSCGSCGSELKAKTAPADTGGQRVIKLHPQAPR